MNTLSDTQFVTASVISVVCISLVIILIRYFNRSINPNRAAKKIDWDHVIQRIAETSYDLFLWITISWAAVIGISLAGHCNSDTICSSDIQFWELFANLNGRYWGTIGNWIFIVPLALYPRISWTKTKFKALLVLTVIFWSFAVGTYIYEGYNAFPYNEFSRPNQGPPPAWLQFLFPVKFG